MRESRRSCSCSSCRSRPGPTWEAGSSTSCIQRTWNPLRRLCGRKRRGVLRAHRRFVFGWSSHGPARRGVIHPQSAQRDAAQRSCRTEPCMTPRSMPLRPGSAPPRAALGCFRVAAEAAHRGNARGVRFGRARRRRRVRAVRAGAPKRRPRSGASAALLSAPRRSSRSTCCSSAVRRPGRGPPRSRP